MDICAINIWMHQYSLRGIKWRERWQPIRCVFLVVYVTDRDRNEDDIVNYPASLANTTKRGLFFLSPLQFLRRLAFRIPSLVSIVTLFPPLYKHVHYAFPWIDVSQWGAFAGVNYRKRCSLTDRYYYFQSLGVIKSPCICIITIWLIKDEHSCFIFLMLSTTQFKFDL